MNGTLYLIPNLLGVATPDSVLPQTTIAHAQRINHFVVETPKVARAFLKTLSPERVIADIHMIACNEQYAREQCLARLREGFDVGVISDAGCPGMADPGAVFVAAAHQAKIKVIPLVGPSSLLLGLMASGMNGQQLTFHGYLPAKADERAAALKSLDQVIKNTGATQTFIETPYRNAAMLESIRGNVSAATALCVAQNLASEGEQIISKTLNAWSEMDFEQVSVKDPALFLLGRFAA
ncbi:MAG: SAM-dependent methyltransferase [Burkholderiales bacterium]|nr:MAG: SAM-dependent methyltransferase [Burkholderiales bacterium]TAG77179.1 MAG: SAM-dependent methyltransferase [Betaproteobacteria bacterium]